MSERKKERGERGEGERKKREREKERERERERARETETEREREEIEREGEMTRGNPASDPITLGHKPNFELRTSEISVWFSIG